MPTKLKHMIFGRKLDLRERLFRICILVGSVLSFLVMLECIVILDAKTIIVPFLILTPAIIICLLATFKWRKINVAAMILAFVIILIVFPNMFFISGGINSGTTVWFALSLAYIFMMFSGKRLAFFLTLTLLSDAGVYIIAYLHPEIVTPLSSDKMVYADSYFAVAVVGIAIGVILKFQMKVYELERKVVMTQKEELQTVSQSKDVFFANMSHEIRTPINTIIGLNEMLLRENQDAITREYAQNIQNASKMLLNLVNDLLDLSQLEIKKMKLVPTQYQTREMFGELIDMIHVRIKKKNLQFVVNVDENIPKVLWGDEKRIKQILLNILTNAVKYTEEGSVELSVRAEKTKRETVILRISVADTGIGIKKENLEYLYDSFQRFDEKMHQRIEGSGLGLSITKQLVELMDGEITVDSIYTKGTTFTVILEQKIVDENPIGKVTFLERHLQADAVRYRQSFEAPEARVLVVDDSEMNATVVIGLLSETKVQIDYAKSGTQCLEKTKQKYYHVILMDYMMSDMNGSETLREVRRQENGLCHETAVIALTADVTLIENDNNYQEQGFDGFIEKPVRGEVLEKEILRFLPDEIVEYQREKEKYEVSEEKSLQTPRKRKKRLYITTDCVCDLPSALLEKYDIRTMYLYIRTDRGRFADTREISSDNLPQYLAEQDSILYADSVSVAEYEEFFAEALTQAEHVIHISMAANAGKSYEAAVAAAKGFDHVHVIDSGHISGGQGLVVLYAARLALEGNDVSTICREVEEMKLHVVNRFLIPSTRHLHAHGYMKKATSRLFEAFNLHPIIEIRQSRMVLTGVCGGELETAWRYFVRRCLKKKRKVCPDIVYFTHVGCSVKQQDFIRNEIKKYIAFEKVITHKASLSNACSTGMEAVSISYYNKQKNSKVKA